MPDAALVRDAAETPAVRATRQNWSILLLAAGANAALLWAAAHVTGSLTMTAAAALFAFTNNTVFALLHEAVHGKFDPAPGRNRLAGVLAAAFFPTAFTLQCSAHLTHHRNNRSELERFDYIGPKDSIPLKTAQWFSILTGLYWLGIPLLLTGYVLLAELIPWRRLVGSGRFARQTSAGEFLESLMRLPLWRVRAEFAFSIAVQALLIWMLDLSWGAWALCYGAFALAWSSLQYADHAFSPLDRIEGSWNLKVSGLTRRLFLNYHCHHAHHRDVACRWQDLPRRTGGGEQPRHFLAILYLMWAGPRLLPGSGQSAARQRLLDRSVLTAHVVVFAAAFALIFGLADMDFAQRAARVDVALRIDAFVPFQPAWAFAYITIAPLLLTTALLLRTPDRTLPVLGALLFELVVAGTCFLLWPVAPPRPPAHAMAPLTAAAFRLADAMNLDGNCFPSLHVALALSCAAALHGVLRPWPRLAIWAWALAIVISTWLTWQHWLLDIVGGAVLAAVALGVVRPWLAAALARIEADLIAPAAAFVGRS